MKNIVFTRVDNRLIHGQVMTKWLKATSANKIIIIDDYLADEEFMVDIYKLSVPSDISIEIIKCEEANKIIEATTATKDKVFLLYKTIDSAYRTLKSGFYFDFIQLGGIPSDVERKPIYNAVSLSENEINKLKEMDKMGVKIEIQIIPEERKVSFDQILKIYNSN